MFWHSDCMYTELHSLGQFNLHGSGIENVEQRAFPGMVHSVECQCICVGPSLIDARAHVRPFKAPFGPSG